MPTDVATVFARRGPLERALPGFEPRPEQARMAEEVREAIDSGRHLLVEAGTGVGKSLAYLVPALLWALEGRGGRGGGRASEERRCVVSTYSRALQEQLARKDLPLLERVLETDGPPLRHTLLMGSENYLCLQRLSQARLQPELEAAGRAPERARPARGPDLLAALARHAETALSGLRSEIPFPVPEATWAAVRRDRDVCLGPKGPFWDACLYRRDLARARESECLVVNHALFFLDLAVGGRILPPHGVVILDEAHRVEEAAAAQFGATLGPAAMARLLRDVAVAERARADRKSAPGSAAARVERGAQRFFAEVRRAADDLRRGSGAGSSDEGSWSVRLRAGAIGADDLREPLREMEESLSDAADRSLEDAERQSLAALALRARDLRERIVLFVEQRMEDAVYWAEVRPRGGPTLHAAPVEVAPMLRARLFESGRTVVLTSATLSAGGSFSHVRSHLGLTAAKEAALGSPYDFRRQALMYVGADMPDPVASPAAYASAVTSQCRDLVAASDGGALLLFTSYALLNRVHEALSGDRALRGLRFFRHAPDGTATALLEEFRASRRGVLLGTLTFWQGVDVPGDALRCVVITRLPFEVPDHPVAEARAELVRGRGGDPFSEDSLPEAILTFRQGFGRLIRSHEDRGVVAVLDPRIVTRAYGAAFLASLPDCRRTSSLEEVAAFFSGTKPAADRPPVD